MSGTRPSSSSSAEHHLGDRLAALVDGELGHDARERVLAHLATCPRCKAEADAQRALKSVFASAAPPPPSEGFLARLQGLPGGPGDPSGGPGGSGGPGAPRGPLEELLGSAVLKSDGFATAAVVTPGAGRSTGGFRVHDVGDRASGPSGRGRRFAFAAASAVSFAAIALGGTLPAETSVTASGRGGQGTGSAVTPVRTSTSGGAGGTTSAVRGTRSGERGAQTVAEEPFVPLVPLAAHSGAPVSRAAGTGTVPSGAVPVDVRRSGGGSEAQARLRDQAMRSFFALSPFIRPTHQALDLSFAPAPGPVASPTNVPLGSHR
ncbi:zf-HC2 domain-containing protein [Streptomyces sp. NPDC020807]|uniref:anti-sigma factor family protein n=1 Tax=Streptomyces sp. NPDC020807 TaxID=3155119 RepID=UPI0033DA0DA4